MSFEERGNALIELLEELEGRGHEYVLIGGYAVSAFNTRFSTDLDIVVSAEKKDDFISFVDDHGFEETDSHSKKWTYDTEVIQYEKRIESKHPIGFDLLVNGLGCRQTNAQWSFEYLTDHCSEREVSGGTRSTTARVVDGSVLAAAKLHSARETDLRDVLALTSEIDLTTITPHLWRGDDEALQKQIERGIEILEHDEFEHGFQSEFGVSSVSAETVSELQAYLVEQTEREE